MNGKMIIFVVGVLILAATGFFVISNRSGSSQVETNTKTPNQDLAKALPESQLIAGEISQYKTFSKLQYDKAIADGKVVFLNFYANWCPICRDEAPSIEQGFNNLNNPNVVGFRVNFKDDETDEEEKALANQFQITYQHSKVIVRGNDTLYKQIAEKWDEEKLIKELGSI